MKAAILVLLPLSLSLSAGCEMDPDPRLERRIIAQMDSTLSVMRDFHKAYSQLEFEFHEARRLGNLPGYGEGDFARILRVWQACKTCTDRDQEESDFIVSAIQWAEEQELTDWLSPRLDNILTRVKRILDSMRPSLSPNEIGRVEGEIGKIKEMISQEQDYRSKLERDKWVGWAIGISGILASLRCWTWPGKAKRIMAR